VFTLDTVVPWGRSFDEYQRMFDLRENELAGPILGCGDGPASFNAEATARGLRVTSSDPLYQFDAAQIQGRIDATSRDVLDQTRRNAHEFVWSTIPSVEELGRVRMAAMRAFLEDYPSGRASGRYVEASLPTLPFATDAFDLALCSHFLFLYSAHLGAPFHLEAVRELCRVAREVRIFPLLALGGVPSPFVAAVTSALQSSGYTADILTVPYEFQRGGNQMLRICRGAGGVTA